MEINTVFKYELKNDVLLGIVTGFIDEHYTTLCINSNGRIEKIGFEKPCSLAKILNPKNSEDRLFIKDMLKKAKDREEFITKAAKLGFKIMA